MPNEALGYGLKAAGALIPPLIGYAAHRRDQRQANEALDPMIANFQSQLGPLESSRAMEQTIEPELNMNAQQAMQALQNDPYRMADELDKFLLKAHLAAVEKGLDKEVVAQKLKPYHELFRQVVFPKAVQRWETTMKQQGVFARPETYQEREGEQVLGQFQGMKAVQPAPIEQYYAQEGVPDLSATPMSDEQMEDARARQAHMTRAHMSGLPFESSPQEVDRQIQENIARWPERPTTGGSGQYDLTDPRAGRALLRRMQDYPSLEGSQALQAQMLAMAGQDSGQLFNNIDDALKEQKRVQELVGEAQAVGLSTTADGRYALTLAAPKDPKDTPIAREERKRYLDDQNAVAEQVASINALIANPDSLDQDQFLLAQRFSGADGEFDAGMAEAEAVRLRKQLLDSYNAHGGEILYPGDPAGAARGYDMLTRKLGGAPQGYQAYRPVGGQPATVPAMPGAPAGPGQPSAGPMTGLGGDVESQVAAFSSQALGRPVEPAAGGEEQPAVPRMPAGVDVQRDQQLVHQAATVVPELRTLIESVQANPSFHGKQAIEQVMHVLRQMSAGGAPNPQELRRAVHQVLAQYPDLVPDQPGAWSGGGMFGDWRGGGAPGIMPAPAGGESLRGALHPSKIQPMLEGMVGTGEAPVTAPGSFLERLRQIEQQQGR